MNALRHRLHGCIVGHLDTGFNGRNLTVTELFLTAKRTPDLVQKYFERYMVCPTCGRKINWEAKGLMDHGVDYEKTAIAGDTVVLSWGTKVRGKTK